MSEDRVRIEVADHVATVTLNRPEKHNALDPEMFAAIPAAAREVATTRGVRAVVLHGAGPSFCSGLDITALVGAGLNGAPLLSRAEGAVANAAQMPSVGWIDLPVPVIAAIHGVCFGGGLQIALGADIRIAAPDARLSVMEVKWGLVADMGITASLPRLLGIDVAKELAFTGRVVDGDQAAALGLVTRTAADPLAAAQELAAEIAARSPDAVRAAKALLHRTWNGPVADGLALEAELQSGLIGSPNQIEAVRAGAMREDAAFVDPAPAG